MSEAMEAMMPIMRKNIDNMTAGLQDQVAQMKGASKGASPKTPRRRRTDTRR